MQAEPMVGKKQLILERQKNENDTFVDQSVIMKTWSTSTCHHHKKRQPENRKGQ